MPVTTIALPQDPSSPSGRNTVIYMVRNKNNLEDLRLRRRLEEYNKQLGFRVKNHDFEKLDTYEFLRQLKDCDSDKLSQFRDIQESIRAMPTPDSMDVVDFSTAIQSLNLAICGQKTELPLLKKNVANNSKNKIAREEGEKLPNIIKRAKTDPSLNYSLLQTKVSRTGSVFKAPTPTWKPSVVPPKEPVLVDNELVTHSVSISNKRLLNSSKKSLHEASADTADVPATMADQTEKVKVTKSVRLVSGKKYSKLAQGEAKNKGHALLLQADRADKQKQALVMSRRSHGQLEISDTLFKQLINANQCHVETSKMSESSQSDTPSLSPEVRTRVSSMKSQGKGRLATPQIIVGDPKDGNKFTFEDPKSLKSPPIFSHSTSFSRSIASSHKTLSRSNTETYKMPERMSLPTLLSLGLGELKDPKHFQYAGIQYAKTRARSSHYREVVKEAPSESENDSEEETEDEEDLRGHLNMKKKYHPAKARGHRVHHQPPVQIRMQNFFQEVDKLTEKPEKILVI